MKAMILCAGQGTRVRPITHTVAKPMIPLMNRPVLSYVLQHLKAQGVTDVVMNVSYRPDDIQSYFRDGSDHGVRISYSYEGQFVDGQLTGCAVGSAGGLKLVQDRYGYFDDTFLVLCGDALIDLDIRKLVAFHKSRNALATLAVQPVHPSEVSKYGIVVADRDGYLTAFQEKPSREHARSDLANTGIYVFEPAVFSYIPPDTTYDIGSELLPSLIANSLPVYASTQPFEWIDVGTPDDIFAATFRLLSQETVFPIPGKETRPGLWCGPAAIVNARPDDLHGPIVVAESAIISEGAVIRGPAVVGAQAFIEPGVTLNRCIVGDYTHVRTGCTLTNKATFGPWLISRAGTSQRIAESRYATYLGDVREIDNWARGIDRPSRRPLETV